MLTAEIICTHVRRRDRDDELHRFNARGRLGREEDDGRRILGIRKKAFRILIHADVGKIERR